ncbi:MAG TPA: site-specific integrase, partial [Acetobacteraceae bacterium]|nr:site-specific integrase [Acetobacteraceae bacterium]
MAARAARPALPGSRHVEAFLEMMAAERGAARNTLAAYTNDLGDFAGFAASRGIAVHEADPATLAAYMASISAAGLGPRTA